MSRRHAVVIGSGAGGSVAAWVLAHAGFEVTIQRPGTVGGGTTHWDGKVPRSSRWTSRCARASGRSRAPTSRTGPSRTRRSLPTTTRPRRSSAWRAISRRRPSSCSRSRRAGRTRCRPARPCTPRSPSRRPRRSSATACTRSPRRSTRCPSTGGRPVTTAATAPATAAAVGEALEARYRPRPVAKSDLAVPIRGAHLAELAHHFHLALPLAGAAKALDYCERAAAHALASLAFAEAERLYARALGVLEASAPGDAERRAALEAARERARRGALASSG